MQSNTASFYLNSSSFLTVLCYIDCGVKFLINAYKHHKGTALILDDN